MKLFLRVLRSLPLLILSPFLLAIGMVALALADLAWLLFGRRHGDAAAMPRTASASVVIPNWNGRDLLDKYLSSVVAAMSGHPENEVIVVDNGSTDGSAEFVRERFPQVKLLALEENLGFGGGSNAGFRAAKNDIVVLLNSDMRVAPDFLQPLLDGFRDDLVFAVSCQIFFSDPDKLREETGLTQGWWQDGGLRVRHRVDNAVKEAFPCFYGGGGSCAFDRRKFLELGGFDHLLAPFYLEDADLGYMAWKRGWKVLYEPRSVVYHEHRGTIGKRFTEAQIQAVLKKNFILFCWKNIHEWPRLVSHFFFTWAGAVVSLCFGDEPGRANLPGIWRAFRQLGDAMRSRWNARSLAQIRDSEAFRRPLGGYFRDRFEPAPADTAPRVLFVSPYPICPPVHGGGVFMYQTLRELSRLCETHVIALLDYSSQIKANTELREFCASAEFLVRMEGQPRGGASVLPHAIREFANADLEWLIHRQIYLKHIDLLQLEYTPLGQYACAFQRLACAIFEHDIYFQSIARGLQYLHGPIQQAKARLEYLRALRYELRMLPRLDLVEVCTPANRDYLAGFLPNVRLEPGLRAGIQTADYEFRADGREPFTMLFIGSFRHIPNQVAVEWFMRNVLPRILEKQPRARLVIAGSEPPPRHAYGHLSDAVELLGFVDDIRPLLARHAVFTCPILSGSGVRVKLLEAFASGIPVVSTRIGAEGLAAKSGEFCLLEDDPAGFAAAVLECFAHPSKAQAMAVRARREVEEHWDMAILTRRLADSYQAVLRRKHRATEP